ncbi:hypothetical protein DFR79_101119 [Halanaerobium saccharolyticum]|uniref:DUF2490 domain-containing protein n=1 Tax=Halanaerobium saccharolyticum TaxID=43595 RepID=A0A4R6M3R3_9FIRM|nr:hypothetical protein [Halanaerobium saccharolyticum]TDO95120.1 hypothetical protein DFR79_101119 [Halanaerobium saccharolyticum]
MKKSTSFILTVSINLTLIYLIILLIIFSLFSTPAAAKNYQPEISGSFESGDKLYTDPGILEGDEDQVVDYYRYDKQWLRYRQQLAVGEYYYLKVQRQQRIYEQSETYDNLNLETEANYTFYLNDKLRSRFKLLLRDKDYLEAESKDYQLARLQYTLQYELNEKHDYELILQRQWTEYEITPEDDYRLNRISLKWGWDLSERLDLDTKIQFDQQLNDQNSGRTDKSGRKISFKFRYKL